jgi:glycosyltransferase involved in cell wall biosynthesis
MIKTVVITANTSWYLYNFRKNTILAILAAGHRVIVIAPCDEYTESLKELGAEYHHIYIDQSGTNPLKDLMTLISFIILYYKIRPNFVFNFTTKNNIYSTIAAAIFSSKSVNNIAGLGTVFIKENIIAKVTRFLYKISQPKAHVIFFQNYEDLKLFNDYNLAPAVDFLRIPGSGVDLSRFNITSSENDGRILFLLMARLLHDKGISHYVEAARMLKSTYGEIVEFRLIGFLDIDKPNAVSQKELDSWVREGVVNYLGVSNSVEKEISQVDCVVLPSFYREGVPKSLLEACAMGKPIVTTDNVGCRDVVDDGINGYLCLPRDTKSLISKLDLIINHTHDQRLKMGLQGRIKVESEFDEKIIIKMYLKVIDQSFV